MPHQLFDEGIFALVKAQKDTNLTAQMVMAHCQEIASYKRPQHVEIWPAEKEFPLTRVAKVDKIALQKIAEPIIEQLRKEGKWDAEA
jgi:non-ribosomal peptide synthetase component E (peptide arylation enzyme)